MSLKNSESPIISGVVEQVPKASQKTVAGARCSPIPSFRPLPKTFVAGNKNNNFKKPAMKLPLNTCAKQNSPKRPIPVSAYAQSRLNLHGATSKIVANKVIPPKVAPTLASKATVVRVVPPNNAGTVLHKTGALTRPTRPTGAINKVLPTIPEKQGLANKKLKTKRSVTCLSMKRHAGGHSGDFAEHHVQTARERVTENNKVKVFEMLHKKLEDFQTDFLTKFETLKSVAPDRVTTAYKFITLIKTDECKLLVNGDDLIKMPKKLPLESVNDFKEKVRLSMDSCMSNLLNFLENFAKSALTTQSTVTLTAQIEEIRESIGAQHTKKLKDLYKQIDTLCSPQESNPDSQNARLHKEIQDGRKNALIADRKLNELKKVHAEQLTTLEKELCSKSQADIVKKERQIEELEKKLKRFEHQNDLLKGTAVQNKVLLESAEDEKKKLRSEASTLRNNVDLLNLRIEASEKHLCSEQEILHEHQQRLRALENEIIRSRQTIDELQHKVINNKEATQKDCQEMAKLKSTIESLQQSKALLECQVEALKKECSSLKELNLKLKESEKQINALELQIKSLEPAKMNHAELSRLQQSEQAHRNEIEIIKTQLSKAHKEVERLKDHVDRDRQLLKVRTELITSLQANEHDSRSQMEEMYAQVGQKNIVISELHTELGTKTEEFRNLFNTLGAKQIEITRQAHMIKLLEESNDRNHSLRVKQEEKIATMEEEINHLKQTLLVFQQQTTGSEKTTSIPTTDTKKQRERKRRASNTIANQPRKRHVKVFRKGSYN